jgi:hypothetical protein
MSEKSGKKGNNFKNKFSETDFFSIYYISRGGLHRSYDLCILVTNYFSFVEGGL